MNQTMQTEPGQDGGEDGEQTQALFQRWRERRPHGARIAKALWAAAVRMAQRYGVPQTAQQLRVEGPQILKHIKGAGGAANTGQRNVTFVAWPGSTPVARGEAGTTASP